MDFPASIVADFAVIMTIAAIVYFIFNRLKQPAILGYLIAGVIIGPYTPPFSLVSRLDVLGAAADLGVILLIFGIGLQFPIQKLRKMGKVSAGVTSIEIAVMLLLSFGIGRFLGWPLIDALFLGTALASTSTTIISKILGDAGRLNDTSSLVMLGISVTEDLMVVGLLVVITSFVGTCPVDFSNIWWLLIKAVAFISGTLVLGILVVPKAIDRLVGLKNNELLLLVVLGLCFGLSIVANTLGFSMATGAFLMGVVIASAKSADKIGALIAPVKDMFAAMFFVSIGALIDIGQFRVFLVPALLITALMVVGKIVGCGFGTKIFSYNWTTSLKVGLGMTQIGEFAFIVMRAGQDLNVISPFLFPIVGVAAAITTFISPYLIRLSYRVNLRRPSHFRRRK